MVLTSLEVSRLVRGAWTLHEKLVPVYNMEEVIQETKAEVSVIYVPPPYAGAAIKEAASAFQSVRSGGLVVCITEGIPILDMVEVVDAMTSYPDVRLIGPNCPQHNHAGLMAVRKSG